MQENSSSLIYGLEFQCRALASLECEGDDTVQFIVGTQGPRISNQVCMVFLITSICQKK